MYKAIEWFKRALSCEDDDMKAAAERCIGQSYLKLASRCVPLRVSASPPALPEQFGRVILYVFVAHPSASLCEAPPRAGGEGGLRV